ncbi:TPA: DUF1566 domain-containing protein [Vibrio vulnificus]|nr:DUF1566 domain-containing protein [Vibrio vulnificus]HAS8311305.1 DUF1566 domain-containing protein [Vibrio vulnificus]HAS8554551.1 DUF1566 domain-containing protein [Vibrio vulnificus]
MKRHYSLIASALLLAGCGGSSSGGSATNTAPTYSLSGQVTLAEANSTNTKVCVDYNQNSRCDQTESTIALNGNGQFRFQSTSKTFYRRPVLAEVALAGNQTLYLSTPGQSKEKGMVINEVTSLISAMVNQGVTVTVAKEKLQQQLADVGVAVGDDLLTIGQPNGLEVLNDNVRRVLGKVNSHEQSLILAQIAHQLQFAGQHLATDVLSEQTIEQWLEAIRNQPVQRQVINDTGVVQHFSRNSVSLENAPSEHYPGQDASFGFDQLDRQESTQNGFKLVKLDGNGNPLADDAEQWSCVQDLRTGLIWENKSADAQSLQYRDRIFTLKLPRFEPYAEDLAASGCHDAGDNICTTQDYAEKLSQQTLCGQTNWRLPTVQEFYNLIDFGEQSQTEIGQQKGLNQRYFPQQSLGHPDLDPYGYVWTSTVKFTQYNAYATEGSIQSAAVRLLGEDRGQIEYFEIYSDMVEADYGTSFQLPVRMVAVKGN